MATYRTKDNDMLDAICFAHYGRTQGIVEQVLAANPGLAELGPVYEAGVIIELPEITPAEAQAPTRLWD